ncbi:hypothetical protein B0O80DRAFT_55334 [Mortierella sp. GBAus27b]|nr:hypothetical protein B0O80DRAFT_55334 [Mortierella sp. GBAus27b]
MDGYAVTWYENNCLWGTFAAFEAAFRAKFHTMAKKGQAYQMACSYKQEPGETVEDAISTLTRLFMTADIDDDKIMCDTLLRALDRDIALVVLRQNPANYQTMCDLVITEGKVLAPLDALRTQHVRPLHGPLRGKLDDLSKQILELHLTLMETNGMVSRLADRISTTEDSSLTRPQRQDRMPCEPREGQEDCSRRTIFRNHDRRDHDRSYRNNYKRSVHCY